MNSIEKYERCVELARQSPCQKLGFGALLINPWFEEPVAEAYNFPIGPLADMCAPDCCRFQIPSRTESMLGACGHAEEACLWQMARNPEIKSYGDLELYVAGVNSVGLPLVKNAFTFTCIRCATQMYLAGIRGIYIWISDTWYFIHTDEALRQAKEYATGAMEADSK